MPIWNGLREANYAIDRSNQYSGCHRLPQNTTLTRVLAVNESYDRPLYCPHGERRFCFG